MSFAALIAVAVQAVGIVVGMSFTTYMVVGFLGSILYRPEQASDKAANVRIVKREAEFVVIDK